MRALLRLSLLASLAALPASSFAGSYFKQADIPVSAGAIYSLDRDALGNLYVLGLPSGATHYRVSGFQTPGMTPLFSFETGVSSPVAFAVEDSGVIDILDASTTTLVLQRFQNTGAPLGPTSYPRNSNTILSAAIDKTNSLVYMGYSKWVTYYCLACLGCACPPSGIKGAVEQYDFNGTLLRIVTMPGISGTAGSCYTPSSLASDAQGSLYVADNSCQHLLKYSLAGTLLNDFPAGSWSNNYYFTARGMWSDPASNLYISQPICGVTGCQPGVVKLDGTANVLARVTADSPRGCAWDDRVLYLSSSGQDPVRRFVDNGGPSVPSEIAPIGPIVQHSSSALLAWQYANDPEGDQIAYHVSLGTSPTQLSPVGSVSQQSLSTLPLSFETTYYWQVVAEDWYQGIPLQRQSAPVVSFRLSLRNSPPSGFSVLSGTGTVVTRDTSVRLSWSPSTDPDGDPVVYDVSWRAASQSSPTDFTTTAPFLTMSGLAFGTTYFWSVRARDVYGVTTAAAGPAEQPYLALFQNSAPTMPAYLSSPSVYSLHTASPSVVLGWAASQDADGDGVTYRLDMTAAEQAWSVDLGTSTSLAVAAVFATTYSWRVVATDSYGASSTGAWRDFIVHLANQPPAPILYSSVDTLITRSTSYALAWQDTGDPDGDAYSYQLFLSTDPGNLALVQSGLRTSYSLGFQYGTTYYWQVTAADSFGARAEGAVRSFLAHFRNTAPGMPTIFSGSGLSFQHTLTPAATLSWSAISDPDGDPIAYRVSVGHSPQALAVVQDGTQTSYPLPSPQLGTTYYWQVSAKDAYGGAATTPAQSLLIQLQNAAPTAPAALTGTGVLATRASNKVLSWSAAYDADGDTVTYEFALSTSAAALAVAQVSTTTSFALTFQYGTTYYWQATARDGLGGAGGTGLQTFLPTFRNSAPTVPANLSQAGTVSYHGWSPSHSIFWQDSADPDGDAFAYSIYFGTDSERLSPVASASLGQTFPNLAVNTAYYYRIVATDFYGAVSASPVNWVYYQFSNGAPRAFDPVGPSGTLVTRNANQTLSWMASTDPDADPVTYRVSVGTSASSLTPLLDTTQTWAQWPGLAFGSTYYWRVAAYDTFGATTTASGGVQSFGLTFRNSAPLVPTVLSGSGVSRQHTLSPSATLSWSAASDPDGDPTAYRLAVGSAPQSLAFVQDGSLTSYALQSPQLGSTYYWQVTAYDPYGGAASTPVQSLLVELQNSAPVAPEPLTGTGPISTRSTSQLLSWSAAADPDGDPVAYEFALSTNAAALPVVQASSATSFPLSFQFGTTYYWRVTARDGFGGASATGLQAFIPTFRNSAPTVPANLSKTGTLPYHGLSPSQSLFWQDAADPDGDPLTYSVHFGTDSERPSLIGSAPLGYTVANLAVNTAYYYRIVATDIYGAASASPLNWVYYQFYNNPPRAFDPVGPNGSVVTRDANQLLSWTASSDPDGDLVTYRVRVGTSSESLAPLTDTTQSAAQWPGLPFGATYYWRVEAFDVFGATVAASGGVQNFVLTFRNSPPSAPGYPGAAAVQEFHTLFPSTDLAWSASADPDADPVSYRLDLGLSTGSAQLHSLGASTTFNLKPLLETTYYWRVTATDPYGGTTTGPWASVLARFVNRAPAVPAVLAGAGVSRQHTLTPSATLSWSAASDPDGDPTAYRLAVGSAPHSLSLVQDGPLTSYALPSPQLGTTYYWQVSAYDPYGGVASTAVQSLLVELQNSPPVVPQPLTGTGPLATRSTNQLLSWSAATDPDGDPVTYEFALSTDPAALSLVQSSTATSYALSFQFGTTYYWRAVARDSFGAAGTTSVQVFQPTFKNSAPTVPANLSKSGTISFHGWSPSLSVFWQDSADPDGDAFTYSIQFGTDSERLPAIVPASLGHTFAKLAADTAYYYRVVATDVHGAASASPLNWVYFQFSNGAPQAFDPIGPSGVLVTRTAAQSLSWTPSSDPDADLVTYRVYAGTAPGTLAALTDTTQTAAQWPGLAFGATYYWRVDAYDAFGATTAASGGVQSFALAFRNAAPSAPLYTSTAAVRDFHTLSPELSLSWGPAADPDGDAVVYRLDLGLSTSSWQSYPLADATAFPLKPLFDTTYYWRVSAADPYGGSTAAPWASLVARFVNRAPAVPAVLGGAGVSRQHTLTPSIALSWSAAADPDGDSVVYRLHVGTSPAALAPVQEGTQTSYALPTPQFGTTYYWQVSAIDHFGGASVTAVQSIALLLENSRPDAFSPRTGMGPLATRETTQLLSWDASRDADGDPLAYGLFLSSGAGSPALVQLSSGTSFLLAFAYGTTYYWRVDAYDGFGGTTTAAGGAQAFYPTFLNDPPAPLNLTSPFKASPVVSTMHNRVSLSWERVTTPQGDPITYTVYLGDSPDALQVLTRISQEQAPGGLVVSGLPSLARPLSQVEADGDVLRLTLSELDYYRRYYFRVSASNPYGATSQTPLQSFSLSASNGFPKAYNYPNPFSAGSGGTRIVFNAPPSGYARATVSIYSELQDLLFRREYAGIPPGISEVGFDGRDRYGRSLFNGSYICHVRFEGPDDKETFYLMVVK
ncbi:MAG: fibronectin type III domain-containing protein [Elusimicrobia bacterium]|nr:fibronectin type III domain-containing protein [Elusimicrobiota bacterium]